MAELPRQTEELPLMVAVGEVTTVTLVEAETVHPLLSVTVTVYVPASAAVTLETVGLAAAEVKPLGPDQLYVYPGVPPDGFDIRLSVVPVQTGLLLDGAAASVFISFTVRLAVPVQPFASVTVTK